MYYILNLGVYHCIDLYIHQDLLISNTDKVFGWFVYTFIYMGVKKCLGKS